MDWRVNASAASNGHARAARPAGVERIVDLLERDDSTAAPAWLLERVAGFLRRPRPMPGRAGTLGELVRVVARLVCDSSRRPALAGFRGAAVATQLTYQSELGAVELRISLRRAT